MNNTPVADAAAPKALQAAAAGIFDGGLETLLRALDAGRLHGLRLISHLLGPARMGSLVANRELRVALSGSFGMVLALGLTLVCPLLLLIISPLILGVPHLLADVRYLVAQPGYHRRLWLALPVGAALLVSAFGGGMAAGAGAVLGALILARGSGRRTLVKRAIGVAAVAGIAIYGLLAGWYWLELALAHLHNFVAVLLFYLWQPNGQPRRRRLHLWPLGLFVVGAAALFGGLLSARPAGLLTFAGDSGLDIVGQRDLLVPLSSIEWATRLLLLFAFAQAVHYTVWLRLIPEEARERRAPRPFRASLSALKRDLGSPLLGIAAAVGVALWLWATIDLGAARSGYFRLALFHGYLEICVLALWWIEGQGPVVTAPREAL